MITRLRVSTLVLAAVVALGGPLQATASPFDLMIGDNDGFGFGAAAVADGMPLLNNTEADIDLAAADRRSAAEKSGTDGAQQTDVYTAVDNYPGVLSSPQTFNVIFPFVGLLRAATWTADMGGFEADLYGQLSVAFNGVLLPGLFDFNDGQFGTAARSFALDADELANANLAQQFVVTISRGSSIDAVAFNDFGLTGDLTPLAPAHGPAAELRVSFVVETTATARITAPLLHTDVAASRLRGVSWRRGGPIAVAAAGSVRALLLRTLQLCRTVMGHVIASRPDSLMAQEVLDAAGCAVGRADSAARHFLMLRSMRLRPGRRSPRVDRASTTE